MGPDAFPTNHSRVRGVGLPAFPGPWGLELLDEACRPGLLGLFGPLLSAAGCPSRHCGMLLLGAGANRHTIHGHLTVQSKPPSNHDVRNTGRKALFEDIHGLE